MARPRHVPERTCFACRERNPKAELVRLVRTPEGRVQLDPSGRANGRGAYLHAEAQCWEKALRRGTMERALKISRIAPEDLDTLRTTGVPPATGGTSRHEHDTREDSAAGGRQAGQENGGRSSAKL